MWQTRPHVVIGGAALAGSLGLMASAQAQRPSVDDGEEHRRRVLHEQLAGEWMPLGESPDGSPIGWVRNTWHPDVPESEENVLFDEPDGRVIGYLDQVAGIIPPEVHEAPGFDLRAHQDEVAPGRREELEQLFAEDHARIEALAREEPFGAAPAPEAVDQVQGSDDRSDQ